VSGVSVVESPEYFRRALDERPTDPSILTNYGNWLKKRGDVEGAEAAYEAAIAANTEFASAYANLAILLDDQGDLDRAETAYRRAVELDPNSVIYATNLAFFMWRRRGDRGGAESLLLETVERQRDGFTVGRLALLTDLAFDDHQDDARELYEEALSNAPNDPWLHSRFGDFLRRNGDTEGARDHFDQATLGEHPDVDALVWYAELEARAASFEAAEQMLRRALRLRRRDANLVASLAAIRTLRGVPDVDVEPLYRQALEWQPKQLVAILNLTQLLLRRDSADEEAGQLLHEVDEADLTPEMRLERLFYGLAYSIKGFEDADVEIQRLLDEGVRVTAWDLSADLKHAQERSSDHANLLARVVESS
jgi:Flp pilus assembly protein TadD